MRNAPNSAKALLLYLGENSGSDCNLTGCSVLRFREKDDFSLVFGSDFLDSWRAQGAAPGAPTRNWCSTEKIVSSRIEPLLLILLIDKLRV